MPVTRAISAHHNAFFLNSRGNIETLYTFSCRSLTLTLHKSPLRRFETTYCLKNIRLAGSKPGFSPHSVSLRNAGKNSKQRYEFSTSVRTQSPAPRACTASDSQFALC